MLFWCECLQRSIVSLWAHVLAVWIYGKNGNLMCTINVIQHKVEAVWIWPVSNSSNIPHSKTLKLSSCLNNPLRWSSLSLYMAREYSPMTTVSGSFVTVFFCNGHFESSLMLWKLPSWFNVDMCVKCVVKFFVNEKEFLSSRVHIWKAFLKLTEHSNFAHFCTTETFWWNNRPKSIIL